MQLLTFFLENLMSELTPILIVLKCMQNMINLERKNILFELSVVDVFVHKTLGSRLKHLVWGI